MRKITIKSLLGTGLVFGALTLGAQQYDPQYRPRSEYSRSERYEERTMLLNRVRADLDDAAAHLIPFSPDRWRIARARESVAEFQRDLNSGNYDRRALDQAIASMERVVDANRLPDRWQESLTRDMNRLRDLENRLDGGY